MRYDAEIIPGGDVIQINGYANALEKLGYSCSKIYSHKQIAKSRSSGNFSRADLFCIVNIERPIQASAYYRELAKYGFRFIIIPIHHPLDAVDNFERYIKGGYSGLLARLLPDYYRREKVKNFIRSIFYKDLFLPACADLFYDYKRILRKIVQSAEGILCIAEKEKKALEQRLDLKIHKFMISPNAVGFAADKSSGIKTIDVIMVGRIESRKNQVGVLKALAETGLSVIIIGQPIAQSDAYFLEFKKLLKSNSNFSYVGPLPYEQVLEYYYKAKLLINASFFEVAPLVDIEAYYAGCHIITTKYGYSSEFICCREINPFNLSGLADIVMEVINHPVDERREIQNPQNWLNAAKNILALGGSKE